MEESNASSDIYEKCINTAQQVLETEANSILNLKDSVDEKFKEVVKKILSCSGRVVFIGMGKSGLVAQKLAATFSSLGTPAFFVHAGEALHGDLGMITEEDVVIAISNSGETKEILNMLPSLRRIGADMIAFTGDCGSTLGEYSDICLYTGVKEEACVIDLAPTASTTATLALGDALAIALSTVKGFTPEDYAVFHPGGSLGRKLLTRVEDVLEIRKQNPVVKADNTVRQALFAMTDSRMGSTSVVDESGQLIGIITDGDIRRLLEKSADFIDRDVRDYMTEDPVTVKREQLAVEALNIMEEKEINDLPAVEDGEPVGMLNFQDLLRAKVF